MNLTTTASPALDGAATLPGDKSLSHRAILFSALAKGESRIENLLVSGVTRAMLNALTDLNVPWQLDGHTLTIQGVGLKGWQPPTAPINCGNSATTLRLLTGALAASGVEAVLDGSPGLRRRPMGRIVNPLQEMGVAITAIAGKAPLTLAQSTYPLRPLTYQLPVASAQVKSCLLLAGLAASGPSTLIEPGPSRDHTERMLRSMGVKVDTGNPLTIILHPPANPLTPLNLTLPGDISSAAFLMVATLIVPGSEITLHGVGLNPTRTGLLDALRSMGANIKTANETELAGEPVGDLTIRADELHGTAVDGTLVVRMIDEFPAFAIAAALAEGTTTVREATELRHKESDRISALCRELERVGAEVTETSDGFIIEGKPWLRGGTVQPHGDHRLAMSFAIAGLRATEGITIEEAEIINESFPHFTKMLISLGANVEHES